jgi:hypothetical protein
MNKDNKLKTNYDPIRRMVCNEIAKETEFTYQFVAGAYAGRYKSETADKVRRMVETRIRQVKDALGQK